MARTSAIYPTTFKKFFTSDSTSINWKTSGGPDWKAALLLSDYTWAETDDFLNDISTGEIANNTSAADLTEVDCGSCTDPAIDTSNNKITFDVDASSITFSSVAGSQTVRAIVIYRNSGGASSADELLCYNILTSDIATAGVDIEVTFDADGLFKLTYSDAAYS